MNRLRGRREAGREAYRRREGLKASYKTGTAEVTYDPLKTTPEAIAKVISERTGFKATAPKKPNS